MDTIKFNGFLLSSSISLKKIASFFNIAKPFKWNYYIVLRSKHIEEILKIEVKDKLVYIFDFGCFILVNFDDNEQYMFIKYLESIVGKISYGMYGRYNESHIIALCEENNVGLWPNNEIKTDFNRIEASDITSIVLAKSIVLRKLEDEVNELLDNSERFVVYLQNSWLRAIPKKIIYISSRVLRFQHSIINNIRVLEKPSFSTNDNRLLETYNRLKDQYEIEDRYENIQSKIDSLFSITKSYLELNHKIVEHRLYVFEIILLFLFPLSYLISYLLDNNLINKIIHLMLE